MLIQALALWCAARVVHVTPFCRHEYARVCYGVNCKTIQLAQLSDQLSLAIFQTSMPVLLLLSLSRTAIW